VEPSAAFVLEAWTTVEHLRVAAEVCEFCQILWLGLKIHRRYWEDKYNDHSYHGHLSRNSDSRAHYWERVNDLAVRDDFLAAHPLDLRKIILKVSVKANEKPLEVHLFLEPLGKTTWDRMRQLIALDFHTVKGMSFQIELITTCNLCHTYNIFPF
jgi:hypothetical protein